MPQVFISYRRADSAAVTGRIHDHLGEHLGPEHVFMDVENIVPGEDFRVRLQKAVSSCRVLLVIIGPEWATITDEQGHRHLKSPDDFVRIEVEAGLQRKNVRVIPILVDGATMPREEDLSPSLRALASRQAFSIRNNPYFKTDIEALTRQIKPGWRIGGKRLSLYLLYLLMLILVLGYMDWRGIDTLDVTGTATPTGSTGEDVSPPEMVEADDDSLVFIDSLAEATLAVLVLIAFGRFVWWMMQD